MKKTVFCNITMQEHPDRLKHKGEDASLPDSDIEVIYPINAYLNSTLSSDDDVIVMLLGLMDKENRYLQRVDDFKSEFTELCKDKCRTYEFRQVLIPYEYSQNQHSELLKMIVREIEDGTDIICDITFGYKDLPIVLLTAISFAMEHLNCSCEYVLYRKALFVNGKPTQPVLCNMASLIHLSSVIHTMKCETPDKSRRMLDTLLDI